MKHTSIYTDDPAATYRGFRRQALYALFRLFHPDLPSDFIVQPEGDEDVAILDELGNKIEVIQVKDYSDNLTASKFKPNWYRRIARHCSPNSDVRVRIVSFGPVGPELKEGINNSSDKIPPRLLDTLTKDRQEHQTQLDGSRTTTTVPGLSKELAKEVLCHLELEEVAEESLTFSILSQLKISLTAGDPASAFENLMWWMLTASENKTKITRSLAIEKIGSIGRFIAYRTAHEQEWNTSIIPIENSDVSHKTYDSDKAEFFGGGRVRFDHIIKDLDVPRSRFLAKLHVLFKEKNIVILHAASGQGKTTLAYRYIRDFTSSDFRFEVLSAESLQHARKLTAAIKGHSEAFNIPTLIYVDVRPGDNHWSEIVRELSSVSSIRVLVTIREEDWARARITQADFCHSEMTLSFEQDEARDIFSRLETENEFGFLDFDDCPASITFPHQRQLHFPKSI